MSNSNLQERSGRVGDVAEQIRGVSYKKHEASNSPEPGKLPVLRANNIGDEGLNFDDLVYVPVGRISQKQLLQPGDIVIAASSGSLSVVGKAAPLVDSWQGSFGAFCKVLRPRPCVDSRYLSHYFRTPQYRRTISRLAAGANINNLRNEHLDELSIRLPSLNEQKRIATILGKADAIRRRRAEALRLADDFLRSTFLDMFGDPVMNPKGFPVRNLSEFYINKKEGTKCGPFGGALKKHEYTDSGIPVWNMDNISTTGRMVGEFSLWITEEKYEELSAYSVFDGDIIISRAGTVGKMCVIRTDHPRSIISTNLIRLRLGTDLLPDYFVSLMVHCKGRVGRLKTGPDGAFTHMSTGVLDTLTFPYPPLELQQAYVAVMCKTESCIGKMHALESDSATLFDSLVQRAFRGEL